MPVLVPSRTAALCAILVLWFALAGSPAQAADAAIRVNTFPNAKALPVYVGITRGFFAKHGLTVEVEHTESSQSQRGPRRRPLPDRPRGPRQCGRHDRGRQTRRRHRIRRRQRHERVLRAARNFVVRGSPRQDRRGRCARYRLRPAGQEAAAATRAAGGSRLHGQAGRRRGVPLQGDDRGQVQRGRNPQSAFHG